MSNTDTSFSFENYKAERESLLQEAFALKYGNMRFSNDELEANKIFENIRKQDRQKLPEEFHFQALKCREQVESSRLYKILEEMPKGSLHHIHISFYLPSKWFVENCYHKDTYIDDTGKISAFEEPPSGNWKNLLKMREESNDKKEFDKNMEDCFNITEEESRKQDVWQPFQFKISNRLAICYREGLWAKYILDSCLYAIEEGFNNLQIRTYVPNTEEKQFVAKDEEIKMFRDCQEKAKLKDPNFTVTIIFVGMRGWDEKKVIEFLDTAREIKKRHGDIVRGVDFVGEEKLREAIDLVPSFLESLKKGKEENIALPAIFHGGESLDYHNTNLYDLYLCGSKRIGHGINLFKHPYLYSKIKERNICIEVNPMSNQILRYIADLRLHPAIGYHNFGLKISLSSDDPGLFKTNTIWDYFAAGVSFEFNLLDFKRVVVNSIETSCMESEVVEGMYKDWENKWNKFINKILVEYK